LPGIEGVELVAGTSSRRTDRAFGALPDSLGSGVVGSVIVPAALALITVLVFLPTLWNGFVEWDDQVVLYQNPEYRGLAWSNIRWMFSTVLMGHWIPLTWLTYGLDYVIWEMKPAGYHLTSLLIFAANVPVFYFVALHLFRRATGFAGATLRLSAIVATLFFAIHPLRVESVAWATERRDVLSGLFFLLTVLMYLNATNASGTRRRWLLAGSVGLYALALVSKGSVMVLPAALIVLDIYPLRRLGRMREWAGAAARRVWLEKIPFVILGLAGGAITYYAQNANHFITPLERHPLSARPAMVFFSLWFYVEKTFLPQGLSPLYEIPTKVNFLDPKFLLPAIAATTITVTAITLRKRWPAGLSVWAYYVIALGPVIGIVHSGHQLTNDRYSYLPTMGFALVIGAAAGAVVRAGVSGTLHPVLVRALSVLGVIWFASLGYMTVLQTQIWRDTDSLWRSALDSDPGCVICRGNFGAHLLKQGHVGLAHAEFERVQALQPNNAKVHQIIGYAYAVAGDAPRAIEHFTVYLERHPKDVDALNNLGSSLLASKRASEALVVLRYAMQLGSRKALTHVNLGYALSELGHYPEASTSFRQAIALQYDLPQAWFGLAYVSLATGDTRRARTAWGILGQLDAPLASRIGPAFAETW
jgi:Flp pilus assembly protein TadD